MKLQTPISLLCMTFAPLTADAQVQRAPAIQQATPKREMRTSPVPNKRPTQFQKTPRPAIYTARMEHTPDINQHMTWPQYYGMLKDKPNGEGKLMPTGKVFPNGDYCGPCTLANNFMYFDQKGLYEFSSATDPIQGGVQLAQKLGGAAYTNAVAGGTNYPNFVRAATQFAKENGVNIKTIRIISSVDRSKEDYVTHGANFKYIHRKPTLDDIKDALLKKAIVGIIYGHYVPGGDPDKQAEGGRKAVGPFWEQGNLFRTGGHWVAPVGYGHKEQGQLQENVITIRDSAGGGQSLEKFSKIYWTKVDQNNCKYSSMTLKKKDETRGILKDHTVMTPIPTGLYKKGDKKLEVLEGVVTLELQ